VINLDLLVSRVRQIMKYVDSMQSVLLVIRTAELLHENIQVHVLYSDDNVFYYGEEIFSRVNTVPIR